MQPVKQKLSVGRQNFRNLRNSGCVYVDKTRQIVSLLDNYESCFLARPRRFGKSLTVSTIETLLSGNRQYFNGLVAAEEFLDRPTFKPRGVISLDFSSVSIKHGVDIMNVRIKDAVDTSAHFNKISIDASDAPTAFSQLIRKVYDIHNKEIAILIDEYDKPITASIDNPIITSSARELLEEFCSNLKKMNNYISFTLVTGITFFAKFGFSSTLNHLTDISLKPEYSGLCGYTQDELIGYFSPSISHIAEIQGLTEDEILEKIKFYYDGYSFDGEMRVYNPYSVITLFDEKVFDTHWSNTSSPTFVEKYMARKNNTMDEFVKVRVLRTDLVNAKEIESVDTAILLYQGGYLTISKKINSGTFILDYPNQEVMKSMARILASNFFKTVKMSRELSARIVKFFMARDIAAILQELNIVLSDVGYDAYNELAKTRNIRHEFIYRELFSIFMMGTYDIDVLQEVFGSKGRADIVARSSGNVVVFEVKVAYEGDDPIEKLKEAENQILERRYLDQHFFTADIVTMVAMVVTHAERRITHHTCRNVRREDVLSSKLVEISAV
ncbi:MAG: ATP-binding protein [Desulfovibrio sp.]|jgi:hypothetical protein|nr:ATP-binding protein [Desulfovibrio sp.]